MHDEGKPGAASPTFPRELDAVGQRQRTTSFEEIPPARVPPRRLLSTLIMLLCTLLFLLAMQYLIPHYIELTYYAATRGRQRAEVEIAIEGLEQMELASLSTAYQLLSKRVVPSVVHINTVKSTVHRIPRDEQRFLFGRPERLWSQGQGSGVIMDDKGHILTNNHVIHGANNISVALSDGRSVSATTIGVDPLTDLALIKVDVVDVLPAEWGDSDELDVGALVWAVGSPFGLDRSITAGILSAKNRRGLTSAYQHFLQTDAAVNRGNSGGPLVDARGRVVGINTAIVGESYQGISFAIPSSIAREVFEALKDHQTVARGWLGVELIPIDSFEPDRINLPGDAGAVVRNVVPGSPAEAAGVHPGDVIVKWNQQRVDDPTTLSHLVADTEIGITVELQIHRDGQPKTLHVEVGRRPTL